MRWLLGAETTPSIHASLYGDALTVTLFEQKSAPSWSTVSSHRQTLPERQFSKDVESEVRTLVWLCFAKEKWSQRLRQHSNPGVRSRD